MMTRIVMISDVTMGRLMRIFIEVMMMVRMRRMSGNRWRWLWH